MGFIVNLSLTRASIGARDRSPAEARRWLKRSMDSNNLSLKDVVISVSPTLSFVAGMVLVSNDHVVAGVVVLVPTIAFFIYSFINLPFQEIEKKIVERNEKWTSSRVGRIKLIVSKSFNYLSIILSVIVVGYMIWSLVSKS